MLVLGDLVHHSYSNVFTILLQRGCIAPFGKRCCGVQIAGGSGITPMLQVASEIVSNPEDKTQVSLIFANQTEEDIILRDELDQMAAKHDNFQVHICPVLEFDVAHVSWYLLPVYHCMSNRVAQSQHLER